jgi:primase-polymerase (primpol)-like protein
VSALDAVNWSDQQTAIQTAIDHRQPDGIGWVFHAGGPVMGVDLDHCRNRDTGEIDPWAVDIIRRLDSYTEVSPSGTGVHILLFGEIPGNRCRSGGVEMYDSGRFFTVTGEHLDGTPESVSQAQQAVTTVYDEWVADENEHHSDGHTNPQTSRSVSLNLTDQEVIEKAKNADKTGPKFTRLWRGDYSHQPSHSEARLELYNYLAFWTGMDERQMWRLFQKSGLYPHPDTAKRGKCDRLKDREIRKAIADTNNVYNGTIESERLSSTPTAASADGGRLIVSDHAMATVLRVLEEHGEMTRDDIVLRVNRGPTQVYKALEALQEQGLVDCRKDPEDKRRHLYRPATTE